MASRQGSSTALALQSENPLVALTEQLEQRRNAVRKFEVEVARKDAELLRAKEEQALLKELHVVNEMTIRKREQQEAEKRKRGSQGCIRIAPDSLNELIAVQDQIKQENKRTLELQRNARVVAEQLDTVERAIENKNSRLIVVKRTTGWDKDINQARCGADAINDLRAHKKILTDLHEEQMRVKATTDRLTKEIETQTEKLEVRAQLEEGFKNAYTTLREKDILYEQLQERLKSLERLAKKKERLLMEVEKEDGYKMIRQVEGDKKVLHHELARTKETTINNSKTIYTQDARLRQLETRLEAVSSFLAEVFMGMDEDPMEGVPEGAVSVPLEQFQGLLVELNRSRETVLQRDDQLENHDGKMEQLERKVDIMRSAIASRARTATQHVREKMKEFDNLLDHESFMKNEFEVECANLEKENETLRRRLGVY